MNTGTESILVMTEDELTWALTKYDDAPADSDIAAGRFMAHHRNWYIVRYDSRFGETTFAVVLEGRGVVMATEYEIDGVIGNLDGRPIHRVKYNFNPGKENDFRMRADDQYFELMHWLGNIRIEILARRKGAA